MKRMYSLTFIPLIILGIIAILFLITTNTNATPNIESKALIIVSNTTCIDSNEMGKMVSFYEYLLDDGWSESDIEVLCPNTTGISEGLATCSNVETSLQEISNNTYLGEVLIYISDHSTQLGNVTAFQLIDGFYSFDDFDSHFDNMSYDRFTMIVNGNQSGLAGNPFSGPQRDIICSMGPGQFFNPDQFNITRGLLDPAADYNQDGETSYVEAFYSERAYLAQTSRQVPQIWQN